jgi:hypothetical protein
MCYYLRKYESSMAAPCSIPAFASSEASYVFCTDRSRSSLSARWGGRQETTFKTFESQVAAQMEARFVTCLVASDGYHVMATVHLCSQTPGSPAVVAHIEALPEPGYKVEVSHPGSQSS